MLDDFKNDQPIAYKILKNSIENDKISHAYIVETNGYKKSFDFVLSMIKYILCKNKQSNYENCKDCYLCKRIDKGEFLELKIIEAEGQWIKKTQLEDLQIDFSKTTIEGNKKIYVIKDAEKLNISSSNSLLKFLEEPEPGIIAILMVENISQLLSTIISRCQILSLRNKKVLYNDNENNNDFLNINLVSKEVSREELNEKLRIIVNFIDYFEQNGNSTIIYINKLFNNYFKERNDIIDAFSLIILFYKDILNKMIGRNIEIFYNYQDKIENICKKNKVNLLIKKISLVIDLKNQIKYNINSNLLMDKLIIGLKGCEKNG